MTELYLALALHVLFFGTWIFYTSFTHIQKHIKKIKVRIPFIYYNILPYFVIGVLMDVLFNFIFGTLHFREFPREFLFTSRCKRHMKSSGIQLARAQIVCNFLLNPFDEGHCD